MPSEGEKEGGKVGEGEREGRRVGGKDAGNRALNVGAQYNRSDKAKMKHMYVYRPNVAQAAHRKLSDYF